MKFKRLISSILLASMALSMVACSSGGDTSSSTTDSSSTTSTGTTTTTTVEATDSNPYGLKADGEYSCSDEPLTLTVWCHYEDNRVMTNDQEIPKELARFTNITFDCVANEFATDSVAEFNLLMTQAVLPDMVGGFCVDIIKYGGEGAFIPLQDLIAEYAPNIQAMFELYPEVEAAITDENGNIYVMPYVNEAVIADVWWIRQDWLDILGLEAPTTVDEFEDVMYAFRNGDPNGNGLTDEIPYFYRSCNAIAIDQLTQLFGVNCLFHADENGQIRFGCYMDEYKYAVERIADWYANGLIHEELFTRNTNLREELFADNLGGIVFDYAASTSAYNDSIPEYVDGFYLVGMDPPADINGDQWAQTNRPRAEDTGWGITVDNQYPVESIKLMDFMYSEQGRYVYVYGIEGETMYYDETGFPHHADWILNGDTSVNVTIYGMGGMLKAVGYMAVLEYEYAFMHEEGVKIFDRYIEMGYSHSINQELPSLSYTTEEADIISSLYPTCEAYMAEKAQKWTMDASLIDAEWDEYIETLGKMGMDTLLETYQAAYDRYLEIVG